MLDLGACQEWTLQADSVMQQSAKVRRAQAAGALEAVVLRLQAPLQLGAATGRTICSRLRSVASAVAAYKASVAMCRKTLFNAVW